MNSILAIVRGAVREARRIGQNAASRQRASQRASLALAFQEMRQCVMSAPHGFPQGLDRSARWVGHLRLVAA